MNTDLNHTYPKSLIKRALFGFLLVIGVLIALFIMSSLGIFLVETTSGDQLNQLNETISSIGFWTQFIRWFLYLLLFLYWQPIVSFMGKYRHWDDVVIVRAKKSRLSTIFILVVVELFLIQSIHVSVYTFLMR